MTGGTFDQIKTDSMKTHFFLVFSLMLFVGPVFGQENRASVLLSEAIYEEEVSGNLTKAADLYLDLVKKFPDDRPVAAKALYHLGLLTEKMGQQKADQYFTRLVKNYPDQKELVALAKARLVKFESLTSEATINAETSLKLASEFYKQLNYKSASEEYEKVIQWAPNSGLAQEAQLWIGQCYYMEGNYDLALKEFTSIISKYPKSTIIPVTELMISQVKQANGKDPNKKALINLDDKTILDPGTGIRYTRINALAGKNDIIKEANSISDVSPNRKFLLVGNKVISFDNEPSFDVFDVPAGSWSYGRLSPDGSKIAYINETSISLIPVSPATGRPTGPARIIVNGKYNRMDILNWSADGEKLVLSLQGTSGRNLWILSTRDGFLKQITNSSGLYLDPVFSKDGRNLIYRKPNGAGNATVRIRPVEGQKSLVIVDSCYSYYSDNIKLSPDNDWLIYPDFRTFRKFFLFRLADKQRQILASPQEVGDLVSWAPAGNKLFYYRPSYNVQGANKVLSVSGGPSVELGNQIYAPSWLHFWAPDSKSFLTVGQNTEDNKWVFWIVPLDGEAPRELEAKDIGTPESLSPDGSKILYYSRSESSTGTDILVAPVSLKNSCISGPPVIIYKNARSIGRIPAWSSDGSKIALTLAGDIWICNTNEESKIQLTTTPESESLPVWSPDGNFIKCEYFVGSSGKLKIIRPDDGKVLRTIDNHVSSAWSPDGQALAVLFENGELSVVSMVNEEIRSIATWISGSATRTSLSDLLWSPDGKNIAFIGDDNINDYENHIYTVNAKGGIINQLDADDDGGKALLRWSPDSKWLSFYSDDGSKKARLEGTLWEADLTDFMKQLKPGVEKGYTTDVDINSVVTKYGEVKPDGTFTDSRDGHIYNYKKIGEQTWMAENLAYLPKVHQASDSSTLADRCYVYGYDGLDVETARSTVNYQKYGVLYNNAAARKACPAGWHLPGDSEWMELESSLGMNPSDLNRTTQRYSGDVGQKLKSMQWPEDDLLLVFSGFNALPGGYRSSLLEYFKGAGSMTEFWVNSSPNEPKASARMIYSASNGIARTLTVGKTAGFSVRCVKDNIP